MIKDTARRSLAKAISWRTLASIDTFVIALFVTGKTIIAAPIAVLEVFTKILLYFFHERFWNLISWGRSNEKSNSARSLIKSISWRLWGTIDTLLISLIISGDITQAFAIGGFELFTKIALYFIHERLWAQIKWGRIKTAYATSYELK